MLKWPLDMEIGLENGHVHAIFWLLEPRVTFLQFSLAGIWDTSHMSKVSLSGARMIYRFMASERKK